MKTIFLLLISGLCWAGSYQSFTDSKGNIDPVILDNTVRNLDRTDKGIKENYVKKTDISSLYVLIMTTATGATEGSVTAAPHGLTATKIIGGITNIRITSQTGGIPIGYNTTEAGYQYEWNYDNANVNIYLHATNSENILNRPVKIIIFYTN